MGSLLALKNKIRRAIPSGPWNFLKRLIPTEDIRERLRNRSIRDWKKGKFAKNHPARVNQVSDGINFVGLLTSQNGVGEASRRILDALDRTNIPFSVNDFDKFTDPKNRHIFDFNGYSTEYLYNINLLHVNTYEFPFLWGELPHSILTQNYTIAYWYWELPKFEKSKLSTLDLADEFWVATNFIKESLQEVTNKPISVIPPSVEPVCDPTITRNDFGLPHDEFLFLCAYDALSGLARKNPFGAIDAFTRAFSPNEKGVGLVIKVSHAEHDPEAITKLRELLSAYSNCHIIEGSLSKIRFNSLINSVDAYVSLHRSEGFGLIPAESMYMGKPVIMTHWSGNTDQMTNENCCLVNYKMVPVSGQYGEYDPLQTWAEPDVAQAAEYMKRLAYDKAYYGRISIAARQAIQTMYSPDTIGQLITQRINEIESLSSKQR